MTSGEKDDDSGNLRQNLAEQLPDHGVREWVLAVGPHAEVPGKFHRQPALHPLALHHDYFRRQGRRKRFGQNAGKSLDQFFHPVAGVDI